MSLSSVSASVTTTATTKLSQMANGEYTAASVSADPKDATAKGLSKQPDGNYGTSSAAVVAALAGPAGQSTSGVQAALTSLKLGG